MDPGDRRGEEFRTDSRPLAPDRAIGTGDLVLHHYSTSPFSEKVRLVLGMKRLRWHSVSVPRIMPKPDVVPIGARRSCRSAPTSIATRC